MSMKFSQGIFIPKNPEKYVGKGSCRFRSSWENHMMSFLDSNPSILYWASESISIQYFNPIAKKTKSYVPDFFIVYVDAQGNKHAEVIEIKPFKETSLEAAGRSQKSQIQAVVNIEKWKAAEAFCKRQGLTFRILTEKELFYFGNKKK